MILIGLWWYQNVPSRVESTKDLIVLPNKLLITSPRTIKMNWKLFLSVCKIYDLLKGGNLLVPPIRHILDCMFQGGKSLAKFLPPIFFQSRSLSFNQLATFPEGILDPCEDLINFRLDNNPLICDCRLGWLAEWLDQVATTLENFLSVSLL